LKRLDDAFSLSRRSCAFQRSGVVGPESGGTGVAATPACTRRPGGIGAVVAVVVRWNHRSGACREHPRAKEPRLASNAQGTRNAHRKRVVLREARQRFAIQPLHVQRPRNDRPPFPRLGAWSIPFTMPAHAPRNDAFDARCHPLIPSALSAHFVPRPGIVHLRLHLLYALSRPGCGLSQRS